MGQMAFLLLCMDRFDVWSRIYPYVIVRPHSHLSACMCARGRSRSARVRAFECRARERGCVRSRTHACTRMHSCVNPLMHACMHACAQAHARTRARPQVAQGRPASPNTGSREVRSTTFQAAKDGPSARACACQRTRLHRRCPTGASILRKPFRGWLTSEHSV